MANCFGSIYNDTEWNKCVFSQIPEGSYCYDCLCDLAYKLSGQWIWTCKPKCTETCTQATASAIIDCLPESDVDVDKDEWHQCVIQKLPDECSFTCSDFMIGRVSDRIFYGKVEQKLHISFYNLA